MTTMNEGSGMPTVGARVVTSDGEDLGHVKEIMGECFKVDAPMQPDYWLGSDTIVQTLGSGMGSGGGMGSEIHLRFTKDGLGDNKEEAPSHKGYHPHSNS